MLSLLLSVIYLSFISLGLPDSMLGSAWPSMYMEFGVPVSNAGILSMIIAIGTILSSLQSDRLTRRLGAGKVTVISVGLTAVALLGFSVSHSFLLLCIWAIPYGLGAGSVDAALNNYVALHYSSRHMSWLHCMWGLGASMGPYIMGHALAAGQSWSMGYRYVALIQIGLTAILLLSLPLWSARSGEGDEGGKIQGPPLTLRQMVVIPGAKEVMVAFFCYCALEQTTALWASSYLVLYRGLSTQQAASLASLFFVGITVGRGLGGFVTARLDDKSMVRLGQGVVGAGIAALLLPLGEGATLVGLILIGLGCAPIYPSMIHATPTHFGADQSQAVIGIQMASAYVGICVMPPLFGLVAKYVSIALLPFYLLVILGLMILTHEGLLKKSIAKG